MCKCEVKIQQFYFETQIHNKLPKSRYLEKNMLAAIGWKGRQIAEHITYGISAIYEEHLKAPSLSKGTKSWHKIVQADKIVFHMPNFNSLLTHK